jgi:hypothetical protein
MEPVIFLRSHSYFYGVAHISTEPVAWGGFYKKPKTENRPEKTEWTGFLKKYVRKSKLR